MRILLLITLFALPAQAQNLLVGFKSGTPRATITRTVGRARQIGDLNVFLVTGPWSNRNPHVEFVEYDRLVPPALTPNDPMFLGSWAFQNIQAELAWDVTTGAPIVIAILDTGLDQQNPDTQPALPGWNIYDNDPDTSDVHGHGTMVTLVVAAAANNSTGNASICWGCAILPIRISDANGNATFSDAADGLNWARTHGAKIANISYEMTGSQTVSRAAKRFQQAGGLTIIAAGNSGQFRSPDNQYIVTVGATDQLDQLTTYTNYGPQIDLNAPGHWTQLCKAGNEYFSCGSDGTSVSAPQTAGAAALIWSLTPTLTPTQVRNQLVLTSDNLRLNLYRALTE